MDGTGELPAYSFGRGDYWEKFNRRRKLSGSGLTTTARQPGWAVLRDGGPCAGRVPSIPRKKGTKFTLLVDRGGAPLVVRAVPANRSNQLEILTTDLSYPTVPGKVGRPPTHPDELHAERSKWIKLGGKVIARLSKGANKGLAGGQLSW